MNVITDIALSILKKYWYILVIAVLGLFLLKSCGTNRELKESVEQANIERTSLVQDVSKLTQTATLAEKDFEEALKNKKDLEWVLDSLKRNPKVITDVHYIRSVKEYHDTVLINKSDYDGLTFNRAEYKTCGFEVTFGWFNLDTIGDFSVTDKTGISIVNTNQRKRLFDWKWTPKWGQREYDITVLNKCGDSLISNYKITKQ